MPDFNPDQKFQYKCPFRKVWVDCGSEEDAKLKFEYMNLQKGGQPEVGYLLNGVRFKMNFASMVRSNVASKRTMEARLSSGQLPFPAPQAQQFPAPTAASTGKPDGVPHESEVKGAVPLSPEALMTGVEGQPFPHVVRKAWGHGTPPGVTMSGRFQFQIKLEDKNFLGELLTWNMTAAGILPQALDNTKLFFTSRHGMTAVANREEIEKILTNDASYPVTVNYAPEQFRDGMTPESAMSYEVERTFLKIIQKSVADLNGDIYKVKHKHQRRTFERYLLYLEDHYYQTGDKLETALTIEEMWVKSPWQVQFLGLIGKTGPALTKVLKGEADVLDYLFGA